MQACVRGHLEDFSLYCRIYIEESLRTNDAFTEQLEDDVADMQTIMGLGAREAADIRSEIVSKTYKYALLIFAATKFTVQSLLQSSLLCRLPASVHCYLLYQLPASVHCFLSH